MVDKKELLQKFHSLSSETSRIKRELSSIHSKRRELYVKYDELKRPFHDSIIKIKEFRNKRDEHTASVKELKALRQLAATTAKTTITDLKKLRNEKEKKSKDLGVKRPAFVIAEEIKKLEFKIETAIIPFEQEQKLNKLIKEKKVELQNAQKLTEVVEKLRDSSKQLHYSKKQI